VSLKGHRDFRRLWAAQAVSAFGARITREGLPILAVTTLAAPPQALGVLAAVGAGAALIVGLTSGGVIDRARRRPILIGADLVRAAVLASLPAAAVLGLVTLPHVLIAAALVSGASVAFDIASHAYLPALIGKPDLVEGNSKLAATDAVAEVGGPALAGVLFQWLTAPIAVVVNAATYLVSAAFLATLRAPEPRPESEPRAAWHSDITQGFRLAWAEPRVRALLLMNVVQGLFGGVFSALYVLFALRTLGLPTSLLGIAIACGGLGALMGAGLGPWMARRLGAGPAIIVAQLCGVLATLGIPLAPANPLGAMTVLIASQFIGDAFGVAAAVLTVSLRQSLLPQAVLGRVGGAFHAASGAMVVLGALGGGLLGGLIGPRQALLIAAIGYLAIPLIGALSPLRKVRRIGGEPTL
jgi:MFS family permease